MCAGLGFYGGIYYQKSKTPTFLSGSQNGRTGTARRFGSGNNGGGMVVGEVVSVDKSTITLQLRDGSQKIIDLSDSTTITKTSTGSATDIAKGATVAAIGEANSDGSVSAQNIQLNPMFRMNNDQRSGRPNAQ